MSSNPEDTEGRSSLDEKKPTNGPLPKEKVVPGTDPLSAGDNETDSPEVEKDPDDTAENLQDKEAEEQKKKEAEREAEEQKKKEAEQQAKVEEEAKAKKEAEAKKKAEAEKNKKPKPKKADAAPPNKDKKSSPAPKGEGAKNKGKGANQEKKGEPKSEKESGMGQALAFLLLLIILSLLLGPAAGVLLTGAAVLAKDKYDKDKLEGPGGNDANQQASKQEDLQKQIDELKQELDNQKALHPADPLFADKLHEQAQSGKKNDASVEKGPEVTMSDKDPIKTPEAIKKGPEKSEGIEMTKVAKEDEQQHGIKEETTSSIRGPGNSSTE